MYTPAHFTEEDPETLYAFMRDYPFATLITHDGSGPTASHIPVEVTKSPDEDHIRILGHVARANSHWELFGSATRSLFIFHGPHEYISPAWYPSQNLVPTWNYAVVHAYGFPKVIEEPTEVRSLLESLVNRFESPRPDPWNNDLDEDLMERLQATIVGFECKVEEIQGKFKLGQNRRLADQEGALTGLESEAANLELAGLTRKRLQEDTP